VTESIEGTLGDPTAVFALLEDCQACLSIELARSVRDHLAMSKVKCLPGHVALEIEFVREEKVDLLCYEAKRAEDAYHLYAKVYSVAQQVGMHPYSLVILDEVYQRTMQKSQLLGRICWIVLIRVPDFGPYQYPFLEKSFSGKRPAGSAH